MVSSYSVNYCVPNVCVCVEWTMEKATVAVVSVRKRDRGIISTTEFHCAMSTRHCFLLHFFLCPNPNASLRFVWTCVWYHIWVSNAPQHSVFRLIYSFDFKCFGSHWDTTISQSSTPLETNFKIFPLFDVSECRGSKTAHTAFHSIH